MINSIPQLSLRDSGTIPQLGFGVFQIPPQDTAAAVQKALETGYRSIDTARAYRNEAAVGEGTSRSGLAREELFITTKLWNADQGRESARAAFERSLEQLGYDYVDLYLIHWPLPAQGKYVETWETLCELHEEGRARSIGVSNFQIEHLERIVQATGVTPSVNQIELSPSSSSASCGPTTRSTASSLRPGARSPRERPSSTTPSARSPPSSIARPPRSSCAGICSSATSSSPSP